MAHGTDNARRSDLIRSGPAHRVGEAFGQGADQFGHRGARSRFPRQPNRILREPWSWLPAAKEAKDVDEPSDDLVSISPPQHLPQLDLVGDTLSLMLPTQPRLHVGQGKERTVRTAARRCGKIVVATPPIGDRGPGDSREPSDLGAGDQRTGRWRGVFLHATHRTRELECAQ